MMEKIQTGFLKVRKSLWSLGSEQNANQHISVCGKDVRYCVNYWAQQDAFVLKEQLYYHSIYLVSLLRHF